MVGHIQSLQLPLHLTETITEESNNNRKDHKKQSCQDGECALVEGRNSTCCQVPANQTLLKVTGVYRRKGYSVTVSASNGAGEGEKSMALIIARELFNAMYTFLFMRVRD